MSDYKKGDIVVIRDFPFGKPLRTRGIVVGILKGDNYNVKVTSGLCEGKIVKYKYWMLTKFSGSEAPS